MKGLVRYHGKECMDFVHRVNFTVDIILSCTGLGSPILDRIGSKLILFIPDRVLRRSLVCGTHYQTRYGDDQWFIRKCYVPTRSKDLYGPLMIPVRKDKYGKTGMNMVWIPDFGQNGKEPNVICLLECMFVVIKSSLWFYLVLCVW